MQHVAASVGKDWHTTGRSMLLTARKTNELCPTEDAGVSVTVHHDDLVITGAFWHNVSFTDHHWSVNRAPCLVVLFFHFTFSISWPEGRHTSTAHVCDTWNRHSPSCCLMCFFGNSNSIIFFFLPLHYFQLTKKCTTLSAVVSPDPHRNAFTLKHIYWRECRKLQVWINITLHLNISLTLQMT